MRNTSIAIVDDNPVAIKSMGVMLRRAGFETVLGFPNATSAFEAFRVQPPGLLLVDYLMPDINGVALLELMRNDESTRHIPSVVISCMGDIESIRPAAMKAGAIDVWPKTINGERFVLMVRRLANQQEGGSVAWNPQPTTSFAPLQITRLAGPQEGQPRPVEPDTLMTVLTRIASIGAEPGRSLEQLGQFAAVIGRAHGLSAKQQDLLADAMPLHDIGMVRVPEEIARNTRVRTKAERKIYESHTRVGFDMLKGSTSPVLQLAAEIALSHHEQWDGAGFPFGLSGEQIPLSARIAQVADYFDVLVTLFNQSLELPVAIERATAIVRADAGALFDPTVVESFGRAMPELNSICRYYARRRKPSTQMDRPKS